MKQKKFDLLSSIVTTYGDTTKTFVTSRVKTKTVESETVLGPPRNTFIPAFEDTGTAPQSMVVTANNRIFICNAPAASGLCRIILYDFNPDTGAYTFIGSLNMQIPATTTTVRALRVDDGPNSATTTGWKIFLGTTNATVANGGIFMANSIDKTDFTVSPITIPTATLTDAKQVYKLENSPFTMTALTGLDFDRATTRIYARNGSATVYQIYKFNYGGSTGAPGAGGIITTYFEFVTGNLPATTGTLVQTNSDSLITPITGSNAGQLCYLFTTQSNTYHGRISDLASLSSAWPTLTATDYNMPTRFINPAVTNITYSNTYGKLIALGSPDLVVVKNLQSAQYDFVFGTSHRQYWELGLYTTQPIFPFGAQTLTQIDASIGWLFGLSTSTSQRGIICTALVTDSRLELHYIITKVVDLGQISSLGVATVIRKLNKYTSTPKLQYRTSGFGSETVGWLDWPEDLDGTLLSPATQIQFRILFRNYDEFITNSAQVIELYLSYLPNLLNSENWNMDIENSTKSTDSPAKSAAILIKTYTPSVPKIEMRAYARSNGALVLQKNTVDHSAEFEYSSNSGVSWNALGVIPNVVNTTRLRYNWSTPIPTDVDIVWLEG